jgi:hypothetical protein
MQTWYWPVFRTQFASWIRIQMVKFFTKINEYACGCFQV